VLSLLNNREACFVGPAIFRGAIMEAFQFGGTQYIRVNNTGLTACIAAGIQPPCSLLGPLRPGFHSPIAPRLPNSALRSACEDKAAKSENRVRADRPGHLGPFQPVLRSAASRRQEVGKHASLRGSASRAAPPLTVPTRTHELPGLQPRTHLDARRAKGANPADLAARGSRTTPTEPLPGPFVDEEQGATTARTPYRSPSLFLPPSQDGFYWCGSENEDDMVRAGVTKAHQNMYSGFDVRDRKITKLDQKLRFFQPTGGNHLTQWRGFRNVFFIPSRGAKTHR